MARFRFFYIMVLFCFSSIAQVIPENDDADFSFKKGAARYPAGYPTGGPGEMSCRSPDSGYASASALRTLADRLRGSETVWCVSNNGTQEGDKGWVRVVCEKKSLASIWLQTWEDEVGEGFCLTQDEIGKHARRLIDQCARECWYGCFTVEGFFQVDNKLHWVEVGKRITGSC